MSIIQGNVLNSGGGYKIGQSLRFNDDDSAYLSRTPSVAGNRKTWTFSTWVKRGNLSGAIQQIFASGTANTDRTYLFIEADNTLKFRYAVGGVFYGEETSQVFRDTSSYYHIVLSVDTTASSGSRVIIYINGNIATLSNTSTEVPLNTDMDINSTDTHHIGSIGYTADSFFDGYLAETHFIDGQALTPDYFGEFDETYGHWKPIKYTGTYGTNGFYLPYSNGGNIGEDISGNGNDFTATNLSATDIVLDSPTNIFCTWNNLKPSSHILSEGNTKAYVTSTNNFASQGSIFFPSSGKYYYEIDAVANMTATVNGINYSTTFGSSLTIGIVQNGTLNNCTGTGFTYVANDILGFAIDLDSNTFDVYKNGILQGTYVPSSGYTLSDGKATIGTVKGTGLSGTQIAILNSGQDSSFAGNKTPQGYTDANGIGDFYYQPPEGYLALCTANLPEPTVVPSEHFDVVTYAGTEGTQSITGLDFQPDFGWWKSRNNARNNALIDSVRGINSLLISESTNAEYTTPDYFTGFTSDGFNLDGSGIYNSLNGSADSIVAWNWKAGGTPVTNNDGAITSQVSANVDAGFSIVGWNSINGSYGTVGHGLSKAPEFIITKDTTQDNNWEVWVDGFSDTEYLRLNSTIAKSSVSPLWGALPTSSVFSVYGVQINNSTGSNITYCFHSVEGYSKIFSYIGNNSADGTFVYLGFQARFVMVKVAIGTTGYWIIVDTERGTYNVVDNELYPNSNVVENNFDYIDVDIVSNGIKFRSNNANSNGSTSYTYIGYAVAEVPFKYANAR